MLEKNFKNQSECRSEESVYKLVETSDPANHQSIRNLFLESKSARGLNIYSNEYTTLLKHIRKEIDNFNFRLKSKYPFSEIKTSSLLDQEDPLVKYYCSKFPEKQYQVSESETKKTQFTIKPACCANAFGLWNKRPFNKRINKHIYHEVDDCYRIENTGSLRSLSRGCYFTMPDYHMIVKNDTETLKDIFLDIRNQIALFYKSLLKSDCKDIFYEVFRVYDLEHKHFIPQKIYTKETQVEYLTNENENEKPYFSIKQEFTAKNVVDRDLQCGTVQLDFKNPVAFNLPDYVVVHFSMGSLQRLVDLLILQDKIPMFGIKVKFLGDEFKDPFLKTWPMEYGLLIDDKKTVLSESLAIKSLKEQIFYPHYLIVGEKELNNNTYTLINRLDKSKKQYTFTKNELLTYLGSRNFTSAPEIVLQSTYLNS